MGTRLNNLAVVRVSDGDTIKVLINDERVALRLACVDTEESLVTIDETKPITTAGRLASDMAKAYFAAPDGNYVTVDLEFDTDDPPAVCLIKHRDNYDRLMAYVYKGAENYNLKLIKEGWSPYFLKYGRSRLYHEQFTRAEAEAQAYRRVIWNPETNKGGAFRPYPTLLPWWGLRDSIVEEYRKLGEPAGVLAARLDYAKILVAAQVGQTVTIFCDLKDGVKKWAGGGALIEAGTTKNQLFLWIDDIETDQAIALLQLIQTRYAGFGRNYAYVTGKVVFYKYIPQIELFDISQISDYPQ